MPISATFDSNVWRKVVSPSAFPNDPDAFSYRGIHEAVQRGKLNGYLGDSMFHLEAIPKANRTKYFGDYRPKLSMESMDSGMRNTHQIRVGIGPSSDGHPGNSDYLKRHLKDALNLGFKLLSAPRIGSPRSPDILPEHYGQRTDSEMKEQQQLCFEVFDTINELGCGIAVAKALGDKYRKRERTWLAALQKVPEADRHLVSKAVAEWADGDSIAGHISYRIDYFCTLDRAVSAGVNSILATKNREALMHRYGIRFVTPSELYAALNHARTTLRE